MSLDRIARLGILAMLAVVPAVSAPGQTTQPASKEMIDPAVQSLASANNAFALELYSQLRSAPGNLFFSPYSIDVALMMVRSGAAGATADEMTRTLKLPTMDAAEMTTALSSLAGRFASDAGTKGYELHVANAMWGAKGASFVPAYLDSLRTNYDAQLNSVDFHNPNAAAGTINDWVAHKTNGRIKDLISPSALNDLTKLILTNAIYFKGDWSKPFKVKATHDGLWRVGTTAAATAALMRQVSPFDYLKDDGLSALQMPYVGGDLAMLVLLPDDPNGLGDLEKSLDSKRLDDIVSRLHHEHQVVVVFPKFKLETKYDLAGTLGQMGMPTAFSAQADLSGIDGKRDLCITGVIHKAFVQVDETGTEAAAATGIMVGAAMVRQRPEFIADHPFLFLIRDVKTGMILFIGRVERPE
jgi:serpin B